MGLAVCWIGSVLQERNILKNKNKTLSSENKTLLDTFKLKSFNVATCTEKELRERCFKLRFSKEKTELAVELFIHKTKQSLLAERLCIEETSIATKKYRLKQELNSPQ